MRVGHRARGDAPRLRVADQPAHAAARRRGRSSGSCVVLPEPVSPLTITTRMAADGAPRSRRRAATREAPAGRRVGGFRGTALGPPGDRPVDLGDDARELGLVAPRRAAIEAAGKPGRVGDHRLGQARALRTPGRTVLRRRRRRGRVLRAMRPRLGSPARQAAGRCSARRARHSRP